MNSGQAESFRLGVIRNVFAGLKVRTFVNGNRLEALSYGSRLEALQTGLGPGQGFVAGL